MSNPVVDLFAALLEPDPNDRVMAALDQQLLDSAGRLVVRPARELAAIPFQDLRVWCHLRAVYLLPSIELVEWLREKIAGRKAIEIGAGHGAVGRALGIPTTDSRMQEREDIRAYYLAVMHQPVIRYPDDIEKLDALEAIEKHKPDVVLGCWIAHLYDEKQHHRGGNFLGVDEDKIVDAATYIHVGSDEIHGQKKILARPHSSHTPLGLFGRGAPDQRRVRIWEKTS